MFELQHKLHAILNALKGFKSGYTSANSKALLVKFDNKLVKVTLEEVGEGEIEDNMHLLEK